MTNSKKTIRDKIKSQRKLLTTSVQHDASIAVWLQLIHQPWFEQADKLGFYMPAQSELDTSFILQTALRLGKQAYLPVVTPSDSILLFYRYDLSKRLVSNRFGILEPAPEAAHRTQPNELDLVLVPLVGFDANCNRLGMGKGYYDRTFAFCKHSLKPVMVGLAYDFQEVANLPINEHDIPLDYVITNQRIFKRQDDTSMQNSKPMLK